ncbi:SusE domain-containing protein [Zhouia sp. PK063]|uniref:SusE domain-containing protein n=1 Tax=Zhouia sp. PK063 TaxID=3373602 RepID=UPI0037A047AD
MKNIFSKICLATLALLAIACSSDDELSHTNVTAVEQVYSPADNAYFNLGAQSSAVFEWQSAKAEDNGVVLYDVAFDTEDGDFSAPIYVIPSDGKGFESTLNLSFTDLNKIAGLAGIQPESTGKLKWTVFSSKGINIKHSDVVRTIEVERPAGYPTPDELYITGTATENGDDLSKAIPMKKTGANTYEVYTMLKPGDYQFVSRNEGTPDTFYIEGNTKLKADGKTTYAGDEKVYRIRLDFSDGSVKVASVEKVEYWFAPFGEFEFELPYAGNGTWKAENEYIEFKQETWGRDERYKFKFTLHDDSGDFEEWYGSKNSDNSRPDANTGSSYWYMVPVTNDRWNNSFKFSGDVDYNNIDMEIIFNTTVPEYTHVITIL